MIKIIHISDLHFRHTPKDNFIQIHRLKCIQERFPTHQILITGDIVDDGRADQYEQALEALLPFKGRLFICPGNHDFGEMGNFYRYSCQKRFQKFMQELGLQYTKKTDPIVSPLCKDPYVLFIGLDSNLHTRSPFDFARGDIGRQQQRILNYDLSWYTAGPPTIILLGLHHHPFSRNLAGELRDWKRFMKSIAGQIDILCFGHKHKQGYWQNKDAIPHILAADSLRDSRKIWEIIIDQNITVNEIIL